jgi:serine/threonine-protein kinase
MGEVFLARLQARGLAGVDKICVVKTLRPTTDPEYERRFIDEARRIVLLSHKNICPVFDAGCFEGEYYLALEHIAGREVRHLQQACEVRGSPLPGAIGIHIIKETLEALDAAHRMVHPLTKEPLRVVHRDVSPQNVMISQEGEVKLIDFGLAVSSQKLERTAPQIVMGKMAYMAPEQARGDVVDARADQFAAAVMLYELLTNSRYYGALPIDAIWRMVGSGGHEAEGLSTLDDDLQRVIRRATAADREQRYQTCGDMRDALTAIELKRGIIAGSRDVRAALQAIDSPTTTMVPPTAPPAPSPSPPVAAPIPKERTRTFRIVAADASDRTESGAVESLEPGTLETDAMSSTALASTTASTTASTMAALSPSSSTTRIAGAAETTVVVRTVSVPVPVVAAKRIPVAAVAVALLVVVVVVLAVFMAVRRGTVPPSTEHAAATALPPVDVPAPPPSPHPPLVQVDATPPIDVDVDSADAGPDAMIAPVVEGPVVEGPVVEPGAVPKRPRPQPPRRKRDLPPFPAALLFRLSFLQQHCGDLACASQLHGDRLKALPQDEIGRQAEACFVRCEGMPPR